MAKRRQPKVQLAFRVPTDWKRRIDDYATDRAMTTSALMCSVVRSFLNSTQREQIPPPKPPGGGAFPISRPLTGGPR
jgi:hypothetical protein